MFNAPNFNLSRGQSEHVKALQSNKVTQERFAVASNMPTTAVAADAVDSFSPPAAPTFTRRRGFFQQAVTAGEREHQPHAVPALSTTTLADARRCNRAVTDLPHVPPQDAASVSKRCNLVGHWAASMDAVASGAVRMDDQVARKNHTDVAMSVESIQKCAMPTLAGESGNRVKTQSPHCLF